MSSTVTVRQYTSDDWSTLRTVRMAALLDAPSAFLTTYAEVERWDEADWRQRPSTAALFGAWLDGAPVGMVGVGFVEPSTVDTSPLFAMWVAPQARGQGVAGALLDAALAQAAQWGAASVRLEVAAGNDRAERVYRRHGFQPVDEEPDLPGSMIMRYPLR